MRDTIFALASGPGRAAVAVLRLSGPASRMALERLIGRCPPPRHASLVALRDPHSGELLDRGLALWFPGPRSFTGEDAAELQLHGGRAVVASVLDALGRLHGCRLAEPGEFTRRAFAEGRLDLAEVEGLADLIDAQTAAQRRQALHQMDGALGLWVADLRDALLTAQALAESAIDFADEGDVAADALSQARAATLAVAARIAAERDRPPAAEQVRDGFVVALTGPPNAGKSTLLNALARRDVALVSAIPGTTRDPIEVALDLGGYAVVLVDTAGLRPSDDPLEQAGIARARARAEAADLVLWLQDATTPPILPEQDIYAAAVAVGTKGDTVATPADGYALTIAARTGEGLPALIAHLQTLVAARLVGGETALVGRARHRAALTRAAALLDAALRQDEAELMAEDLRSAAAALLSLVGRIDVEDVLGSIFSRFCIGK
ncbi:tRNA uridine-5-carboxymethylaminomethyl(34) synthesis GTPase MnmE [Lichenihabitans sp. Uapishka_5]|uniref:tRNA uridine-5-carboxymethylaminomethyl(34) synthesis GTPase MnmE n=1 Tax=Lichenihabitans sp. Uapishka_5 TaxID=3037302 RepID=UPI0029E7DDB3|nr:tRNA uridine-5-carboxymethylaminomethyl(34) synthesis GTPase MnmE [Lichenihabitans sp. Uapishka_5]MDX7952082.1 tRNA uridine-5-carboxymethylaminomethyl(34) synthesis GTPase MnmE [Lichenihabitans sp. Uapishka_5]